MPTCVRAFCLRLRTANRLPWPATLRLSWRAIKASRGHPSVSLGPSPCAHLPLPSYVHPSRAVVSLSHNNITNISNKYITPPSTHVAPRGVESYCAVTYADGGVLPDPSCAPAPPPGGPSRYVGRLSPVITAARMTSSPSSTTTPPHHASRSARRVALPFGEKPPPTLHIRLLSSARRRNAWCCAGSPRVYSERNSRRPSNAYYRTRPGALDHFLHNEWVASGLARVAAPVARRMAAAIVRVPDCASLTDELGRHHIYAYPTRASARSFRPCGRRRVVHPRRWRLVCPLVPRDGAAPLRLLSRTGAAYHRRPSGADLPARLPHVFGHRPVRWCRNSLPASRAARTRPGHRLGPSV